MAAVQTDISLTPHEEDTLQDACTHALYRIKQGEKPIAVQILQAALSSVEFRMESRLARASRE